MDSPPINTATGEPQSASGWSQDSPAAGMGITSPDPRRLSPQSTGNMPFKSDIPAPPQLHDMPQAPKEQFDSPFNAFKDPMILLAGLGSLLTRQPLTTAMTAATEAMNGYHQGQKDVFQQKKSNFDEQVKAALAQNNIELTRYKELIEHRSMSMDEKMGQMYAASGQFNDPLMRAAVESHNWPAVVKLAEGRDKAQTAAEAAVAKQQMMMDLSNTGPVKEIKGAIERGEQPPELTGLYKYAAGVRAGLAADGFDLAKANIEWQRAKKQVASLNSTQMQKFAGLSDSVSNTINEVNDLAGQMKQSGITALNRLNLEYLANVKGNSPEGLLAIKYITAVGTLKEEFANLANGGYAPTEPAWALANKQINENYGVDELNASLIEIQRLINYRKNAMPGFATMGPGAPNRYEPTQPAAGTGGWSIKPVE